VPVAVSGGHTWTSVTAGASHTCGLRDDGKAYCWGRGTDGSLGSTTADDSAQPVEVTGGHEFRHLSAGNSYTCGVTTDDVAYCWGWIGHRLGHGSATESTTVPVQVVGGHSWSIVETGQTHTCGITTEGAAFCWGTNSGGQLGNGTRGFGTESAVPTAVGGSLQFSSISPSDNFTCGVTIAGAAYCWGTNLSGQLGTGSSDPEPVLGPVAVAGDLTFAAVSTGRAHACGTTVDGEAYCWGWNAEGQLGVGDRTERRQPSRVAFP
jgi:alpha-tubulin suppressor-like RCC1 family protein